MTTTTLGRRGFGSLLLATVGAVVVRPSFGLGATGDPPAATRTVNVSSTSQLTSALANALPGDHIVLATATYSGSYTLSRSGIATAPIVVKAAVKHGATLTGTLTLAGRYTVAYGLKFSGTVMGVRIANHDVSVLRNWFLGPRGVYGSTFDRPKIGYNRFSGGPVSGLPSSGRDAGDHIIFDIPAGDSTKLPEGGRIFRNEMRSPSGSGASGEYHHIYIGPGGGFGDDRTPSFTDFRIEYNLIADTVRRRGIYSKRGSAIEFNQITGKGPGVTGIRHGGNGSFSGNRCNSIDSVIINGPDHQVKGNFVRARRGIVLESERRTSSGIRYNAAHNALLVRNDANQVIVGNFESGDTLVANVSGVRIYNHVGPVTLMKQVNTVQTSDATQTAPAPVTLLTGQAGPDAP